MAVRGLRPKRQGTVEQQLTGSGIEKIVAPDYLSDPLAASSTTTASWYAGVPRLVQMAKSAIVSAGTTDCGPQKVSVKITCAWGSGGRGVAKRQDEESA